jgi:uncharacterized membrane protein YphA (DoxX/SURF4 family)
MYVWVACRVLIGAVFLAAAAGKLRSRSAFAGYVESLRALRMLPTTTLWPVAVALAAAEAAVPVLLARGATARPGSVVAVALLGVLTTGVAWALVRRTGAACRCFGGAAVPLRRRHLLRNGLLLGVAVVAVMSPAGRPAAQPGGVAVAVAAGLVLAALAVRFDDLADLFSGTARTPDAVHPSSM